MAAWKAAQAGHDVAIFEAGPLVGGMAASFDVGGQRVDFGSHRLHPATDASLLDDIDTLLGDDLQARVRNGRIRLLDTWVAFPLQTGDLIKNLPKSFAIKAALDVIGRPFRRHGDATFESEIRAGLGPTVAEAFYEPYALKLWDTPAAELDAALAAKRVSASSPLDIAKRIVRSRTAEGKRFYYPRLGYGQISEQLAAAAVAAGATIALSSPVESVDLTASAATVSASGNSHTVDIVWSTAPIGRLVDMVTPAPTAEIRDAAMSLKQRAMVLVYLICDQERYTTFDAHYFPSLDTPIARLSEPKNYRTGPDLENKTVLCAELACWPGDEIWSASDVELGELVSRSLEQQELPTPHVGATETRRLRHVYPVYRKGYQQRLTPLLDWADQLPRFVNFGRQALFAPDNLHHTLAMGAAAAQSLGSNGTFDRDRWAESLRAFNENVVED